MRLFVSTFLFFLFAGTSFTAHAQNILRDERRLYTPETDRHIHPELRAEGLTNAGFIFKPKLEIVSEYDSNVRAANNEDGDFFVSTKPSLSILKKYDGHTINGFIGADVQRYASEDSEDKENFEGFLRGYFDLNSRWAIPASIAYNKKARARDIPQTNIVTEEPEDITRMSASLGLVRRFNRLSLALISEVFDIENDDGTVRGTSTPAIFSDNDRRDISGIIRARYEFLRGSNDKPEHVAFADFKYTKQDFDRNNFQGGNFSGASGDNKRLGVFAGFETTFKDLLFANIGAGYTSVDYDDSSLDNVDLFTLSADATYAITPKLGLNFEAKRQINQNNDFLQGFEETLVGGGFDYELKHNLLLGGHSYYSFYDFIDNAREDDNFGAEMTLRYLNSHRLESRLGIGYFERDSNNAARSFDRTRVMLSLIGKL